MYVHSNSERKEHWELTLVNHHLALMLHVAASSESAYQESLWRNNPCRGRGPHGNLACERTQQQGPGLAPLTPNSTSSFLSAWRAPEGKSQSTPPHRVLLTAFTVRMPRALTCTSVFEACFWTVANMAQSPAKSSLCHVFSFGSLWFHSHFAFFLPGQSSSRKRREVAPLHVPVNAAEVPIGTLCQTPLSNLQRISVGSNGSSGTAARKLCALGTQTLAQHLLKPCLPLSSVWKPAMLLVMRLSPVPLNSANIISKWVFSVLPYATQGHTCLWCSDCFPPAAHTALSLSWRSSISEDKKGYLNKFLLSRQPPNCNNSQMLLCVYHRQIYFNFFIFLTSHRQLLMSWRASYSTAKYYCMCCPLYYKKLDVRRTIYHR